MKIEKVKVSAIKSNPKNPRLIKDDKFFKLVKSVKEFPQMLELRPIVVNEEMIVLGGNMRLKACIAAGYKEIPVVKANDLTAEQQNEFIIKDNVSFGEWDYDLLANEWETFDLSQWALTIPNYDNEKFEPNLIPDTKYSDITKEQIMKEAELLANKMLKIQQSKNKIECICPQCNHEFEIDG